MDDFFDTIVVGGGAAGLSAALMLGRARRRVLVLDGGSPRNRFAAHMNGVLGHDGTDPAELLRTGRTELAAYDVEVVAATVDRLDAGPEGVEVAVPGRGTIRARSLVLATGVSDDLPDLPGLREHWGTSVLHCPYCHGWEVRDGRIGVLALSPMALHHAELLRQWTDRLTFLSAGAGPLDPTVVSRLESRGVRIEETPVVAVLEEDGRLCGVRLEDGRTVELDAVFTGAPLRPHDQLVEHLGLERQDGPVGSFLAVDPTGRTSHPRIWAAGNVVNPMANVPISISAGTMTGAALNAALVAEDFDLAVAARAEAARFWEDLYAGTERRWSGRVNPTTAAAVVDLPVGRALDLGCGEGGDAVWLAEHGWRVTAVDISPSAVARGAAGAAQRGVSDRVDWLAADLATWTTEETFDLVTASFLHSPVALQRAAVLARAGERVRSGGHLVVVAHVFESVDDLPPWAWRRDDGADGEDPHLMPRDGLGSVGADPAQWEVVRDELVAREATSPDGTATAEVKDGLLVLRRR